MPTENDRIFECGLIRSGENLFLPPFHTKKQEKDLPEPVSGLSPGNEIALLPSAAAFPASSLPEMSGSGEKSKRMPYSPATEMLLVVSFFRADIMPEARDRLLGPAGAGDLEVGFGIHRGFDGRARIGRSGQNLQRRPPSNAKENIPPESSRSARRRTRPRKSPLPSWYPRSPLQDITAVVRVRRSDVTVFTLLRKCTMDFIASLFGNDFGFSPIFQALERRRSRLRFAAELRRRQERANHSPVPLPSTPPRQELQNSELLLSPHHDEESDPLLNVSDLPASPAAAKSSLLPIEDPPETLPPSEGLAPGNRTLTADEKKCEELIDEFQKVVTENLKRIEKVTPKKKIERRTLMSMR
ncbi:negative regulation of ubiquitin-protein transferase [Asimina triloba]